MNKQPVIAIEYSAGNICVRAEKSQIRIKGEFSVEEFEDIIDILKEGKVFDRYSGIDTLNEKELPIKSDKSTPIGSYIVDYDDLPLFINYISKKNKDLSSSVIVRLHDTRFAIMKGGYGVLYRAVYNLINQGAYSQIAAQLINEGGRRWVRSNSSTYLFSSLKFEKECGQMVESLDYNKGKIYSSGVWSQEYDLVETMHGNEIDTAFGNLRELTRTADDPVIEVNPFGFVSSIEKNKTYTTPSGRTIYFYRGQSAFSDTLQKPVIKEMNIGGLSENESLARLKAYAEAAERHCSGIISSLQVEKPVSEIASLTKKILGRPTTETLAVDSLYPTVRAKTLKLGSKDRLLLAEKSKDVFLPLDTVYYPYRRLESERFAFTNSSGCAAHSNYYDATINAMLELSERDSLMIMWLNKLSLPRITNASLPQGIRTRIDEIESYSGMEVILLDGALDKGVPTVVSVIRSRQLSYPNIHIGAGAAITLDDALNKAINELESLVYFSYYFDKTYDGPLPGNIEAKDATQLKHHYLYYHNPEKNPEISFMTEGDSIEYTQMVQDASLEKLFKAGGDWYVLDLTNSYFDKHNIKVVRVFSTEMVPIWFGQNKIPSLKKRINDARTSHGHLIKDVSAHKFPFLHPMG